LQSDRLERTVAWRADEVQKRNPPKDDRKRNKWDNHRNYV